VTAPFYADEMVTVHHGDCLEVMRGMPDASVDAIVTDPPYGLGFMGKAWDDLPPRLPWAQQCLRVLKPGGHLLAFGGSRTWHRLACAIEDAGFELRDSIAWLYGSGFPKSLDVSKAIDKVRSEDLEPQAAVARFLVAELEKRGLGRRDVSEHFGAANIAQQWTTHWTTGAVKPRVPSVEQWAELRSWLDLPDTMDAEVWRLNGRKGKPGDNFDAREVLSERVTVVEGGNGGWSDMAPTGRFKPGEKVIQETAPATPAAQQWQGWGTALKPAFEPIVVARKPLVGTVAANILAHGTGALNIDGCRVEGAPPAVPQPVYDNSPHGYFKGTEGRNGQLSKPPTAGRWPTNVVLDGDAAAELDEQSGISRSSATVGVVRHGRSGGIMGAEGAIRDGRPEGHADSGGASRFFPVFRYEAKAPTHERPRDGDTAHPTVKPLDLMRWLVRLVTPPGGTVLDPFAGTGTTAEACIIEGAHCVTIEREAAHMPLIVARLGKPIQPDLFGLGT
jgi:DNA modification methylase